LLARHSDDWRAYNMVLEIAQSIVTLVDRFLATRGGLRSILS
jgi:hypothetical protein